jgi:hypothetical protein
MNEVATLLGLRKCLRTSTAGRRSPKKGAAGKSRHHVTIAMYFGKDRRPAEEILSRAAWSGGDRRKNGTSSICRTTLSRPARVWRTARSAFDFVLEAIANDNAA